MHTEPKRRHLISKALGLGILIFLCIVLFVDFSPKTEHVEQDVVLTNMS